MFVARTKKDLRAWATEQLEMTGAEARASLSDAEFDKETGEITYHGYLAISAKPVFEFPDNLKSITDGLYLENCENLSRLPEGLSIEDSLSIIDCDQLVSLPIELKVAGSLELEGCAALENYYCEDPGRLHQLTRSGRDIHLQYWQRLKCLPTGFATEGNLTLLDLPSLTDLPEGLSVAGWLMMISRCPQLRYLAENTSIAGWMSLAHCPGLQTLPASLRVGGRLMIEDCQGLEESYTRDPARLKELADVANGLSLSGWEKLWELPDGLSVTGGLSLQNCTNLFSLPIGLKAGHLDLNGCPHLERYYSARPERLLNLRSMAHGFSLSGWKQLKRIPDGLSKVDSLDLSDCTNLESLPEHLEVKGSLDLHNCKALRGLPPHLKVGKRLTLSSCPNLVEIGEGLDVGTLQVRDCPKLVSLPDDIRVEDTLTVQQHLETEARRLHRAGKVGAVVVGGSGSFSRADN